MKFFTIEAPTDGPCKACAEYYAQLHTDNGVIAAAIRFVALAVFRGVSPFQAIDEYMAAVHASGHVDNASPLDAGARIAALHDEEPARLRVTPEMIREQKRARIAPHRFEMFPRYRRKRVSMSRRHELYAWVVTEPDSKVTAIVTIQDSEGRMVPLVDLNKTVALLARPFIIEQEEANKRHAPVRLVRFVETETLDSVMPH